MALDTSRATLSPADLFDLSVVRTALTHFPMPVVLFVGGRVAYANASAGVPIGAPASGWSLTVAMGGKEVRDGFVLVRLDGVKRVRLRGHLAPLRGSGAGTESALMAVDDTCVESGRVGSATPEGGGALTALTPREREVFRLIARGARTREIGARLGITPKTVETHRTSIHRKLGLTCLADVMRLASTLRDAEPTVETGATTAPHAAAG